MEAATGLAFPASAVDAIVSEGRPMASFDGRTIRLRASYAPAYKKATLAHEIGHRLAFTLPRRSGLDDHRLLYLFLYDVWTDLYGREFADRMVSIERRIGPAYESAWTWALAMSREERQARLKAVAQATSDPIGGRRSFAGGSSPDYIRPQSKLLAHELKAVQLVCRPIGTKTKQDRLPFFGRAEIALAISYKL